MASKATTHTNEPIENNWCICVGGKRRSNFLRREDNVPLQLCELGHSFESYRTQKPDSLRDSIYVRPVTPSKYDIFFV